jgi:hypothetical protein
MVIWLIIAIGLVLAWQIVGLVLHRSVLFPVRLVQSATDPPAPSAPGLSRYWLKTPAGRTEMWFMPGDGVDDQNPGPLVIHAHGNGELIDIWPAMLEPYRRMGVSVALVEYRGYGRSAGQPNQKTITADFIAAYDQLAARADVEADRIIGHGRSVGSGAICALADRRPLAAMVLESPFASVTDIALGYGILPWFVTNRFNNLAVVAEFQGPILLLHGQTDRIIPIGHSRKLSRAASDARLVTFDCSHNDMPVASDRYWQAIEQLLRPLVDRPKGQGRQSSGG